MRLPRFLQGRIRGFIEILKSQQQRGISVTEYESFSFEDYYEKYSILAARYPKIKSAVMTISGQTVADGIFLQPAHRRDPDTGRDVDYQRSLEAAALCEKLNRRINLKDKIFRTASHMVKYGTCWWEKSWEPELDADLVHQQRYMKPRYSGRSLVLEGWDLRSSMSQSATVSYSLDEVITFTLDADLYYPYGTSLLSGVEQETDFMDEVTGNLRKYLKRQAWAPNALQVGDGEHIPQEDEQSSLRSFVQQQETGDTLLVSYPIKRESLGSGDMETRMIPDTLRFIDDQIADSLITPPLSKLYNSTEASAKEIRNATRASLIVPIQDMIARKIEDELYWPYLEDLGYSRRVVPAIVYEPPEAGRENEAAFWTELVNAKIASPRQAALELGIEYDEEYFTQVAELAAKQLEQSQAGQDQGAQEEPPTQGATEVGPRRFEVKVLDG